MSAPEKPADSASSPIPGRVTFIDSASLYEVVAVFEASRRDTLYPWAWSTAIVLTHALIQIELLRMAPAPTATTKAAGLYKGVTDAVIDAQLLQRTSPTDNDTALAETQRWAAENTATLGKMHADLVKDDINFGPWLNRSIEQAWVEHANRLEGLFNVEFAPSIALTLNTHADDLETVRKTSLDVGTVKKLAKKMPNSDEFDLMRSAYVVSTLIRGYYHQVVARNRGEHMFRHPLRRCSPLPPALNALTDESVQYRYAITPAQSAFASIVLANAKGAWRSSHRPRRWVEVIRLVREVLRPRQDGAVAPLAATNLEVLSLPDTSTEAAVQAARSLGIACPSRVLTMALDFAGGAGFTYATGLALTSCPPAALLLPTLFAGGVGGLVQPSKIIFDKRLERFARHAPGAIDYVWDAPPPAAA